MKKTVLLLALFFAINVTFSQVRKTVKPNYKSIKKEISTKKSKYYYAGLFKRYLNGDTTFSTKEKRMLYYGYTFQEKYLKYQPSAYSDSLVIVMKKGNLSHEDDLLLLKYANKVLGENPFDIRALNSLAYLYEKTGDKKMEKLNTNKMTCLFEAMASTGDGTKLSEPIHIIFMQHEAGIIEAFGFRMTGLRMIDKSHEFLSVSENKQEVAGFYFDVSKCIDHPSRNINH